jgi:hypothetical protein
MWLPEIAVSWEIMDEASRQGIQYFILMSHQAFSVKSRKETGKVILDEEDRIKTDSVYECFMSDGRKTRIVFVNDNVHKQMTQMSYLMHPKSFSDSLLAEWKKVDPGGVLMMASDGEYYGHCFGKGLESIDKAFREVSYYGANILSLEELMANLTISGEIEIRDKTSWTCKHGIDRWISNCGCRNDHNHRDQNWKAPLHAIVVKLALAAHKVWLEKATQDRKMNQKMAQEVDTAFLEGDEAIRMALVSWVAPNAFGEAKRAVYDLMELRCYAFLIKNSCVFYFETLDREETRQFMKYAAKMAWIMESFGVRVFSWLLPALKEITCEGFTAQQIFISSIQEVPEAWCKERSLPSPEELEKY